MQNNYWDKEGYLLAIKGNGQSLWKEAHQQAYTYYLSLINHPKPIVSKVSQTLLEVLKKCSLYQTYIKNYNEEYGSGRGCRPGTYSGIPLSIEPNMYHVILLLSPDVYLQKLELFTEINPHHILRATRVLGPVAGMLTIKQKPIRSNDYSVNGWNRKKLYRHAILRPDLNRFIKLYQPETPDNETVNIARLQVPHKPLAALNQKNLDIYGFRQKGFAYGLLLKSLSAVRQIFKSEKSVYIHARAGKLQGWTNQAKSDPDWVVPLYQKFDWKWITTPAGDWAFAEPPFLNLIIKINITGVRSCSKILVYE